MLNINNFWYCRIKTKGVIDMVIFKRLIKYGSLLLWRSVINGNCGSLLCSASFVLLWFYNFFLYSLRFCCMRHYVNDWIIMKHFKYKNEFSYFLGMIYICVLFSYYVFVLVQCQWSYPVVMLRYELLDGRYGKRRF